MSDFDMVLERLLADPAFAGALAADPAAALAGYRLSPDEAELLRSQVSTGAGGDRAVETRTSKASMMGLLGPLSGLGLGHEHGQVVGRDLGAHGHAGFGANAHAGFAPQDGPGNPYDDNPYDTGAAGGEARPADQVATDYHARIDADGDGWMDSRTQTGR